MQPYRTSPYRTVFVIAAVAMTAITIGLTVVVPATMGSASHEARTLAEPAATTLVTAAAIVTCPCVDVAQRP